ncbi:metal ABC transporter permease [Bythopirellula goksoeyrii]|uniref:Manganese transport system membrane protein MntB n=1 Tax=Bythopirellula goksoeyrii TaxID=1400387 RepID=A0A5B9Q941_9BACT|nr:metal ABC transporter permease [Bythopirellula goksoeyrii]QEG35544.1 Manganese transport system membrane protein MntB [Bythopirellula goksoeyrii]
MIEVIDLFGEPSTGTWIVLTGVTVNAACALVGCFLILRKMSLMGDALSHAVLPGLVIAFVLTGSRSMVPMFVGAVIAGLLTTFMTQSLHQYLRVPSDASMGIVFTAMFAVGVVLVKQFSGGLHFDIGCVYEGALEYVPFGIRVAGMPRQLFTSLMVMLLNLAVILVLWKEFKLSSFDPALATTMGFSATAMHYLLMVLVSVTTVASFEAVGSILVVAMLIVPASTAYMLTDRLGWMVLLSVIFGAAAAVLGFRAATYWDTSISGMMTVVAGCLYALAVLVSPRYGLVSSMLRNVRMSLLVLRDDVLAMLYRVEELGSEKHFSVAETAKGVGGGWLANFAISQLQRAGNIVDASGGLRLTDQGRETARKLVRSHRLWETYLVEQLGMPLDHVHEPAHRVEHFIDEDIQIQLAAELDTADQDPHGRQIPE